MTSQKNQPDRVKVQRWQEKNEAFLPFALAALHHLLLSRVPVGPAAAGAGQALVPLLIAGVADGVVVVPPRGLTGARRSGAAIGAFPAALK